MLQDATMRKPNHPEFYNQPYTRTRAEISPIGTINIYQISTSDIRDFLSRKVAAYAPGARVEVLSRYIERADSKKDQNPYLDNKYSYAALNIGLSSETIETKSESDFIHRMIEQSNDVRTIKDIYVKIIKKYQFDRDELQALRKNYKRMDQLREAFGITDEYMNTLIRMARPMRQRESNTNEAWVIFAARPEAVLYDMLTEIYVYDLNDKGKTENKRRITDKEETLTATFISPSEGPRGKMYIDRTERVDDKDNVLYTVHLLPHRPQSAGNPEVREFMKVFK